jgi:hypothetical protein
MQITGTLPIAGAVTIVQIIPTGMGVDVAYIDSSANLKIERVFAFGQGVDTSVINIATSVTIV